MRNRNLSDTKSTIYKGGLDDNATTINDQLATVAGSAVKNKLATDKQQKQAFIKANMPKTDSYKPKELVLNPAPFEMTQSQILQNLRTLEDNGLSRGLPIDDGNRVIAAGSVIVTLSVKEQLFASETINICVPADKALGFAAPQLGDSVPVPPPKVRIAVPSFPPLQLTTVVVAVTDIALG